MKTKQTIEQRAEAEKANYRWHTTTAIGRPLPVGTLRVVGPRNVPGSKHPDGYFVSFAGCSCEASGFCRHQFLLGKYYPEVWLANVPDMPNTFTTAKNHIPAFTCDRCNERTFGTAVKVCATSGLYFCSDECMDEFFNDVDLDEDRRGSVRRNLAAEARL